MMQQEQQLKLQAYLDGELPEAEARAVAEWLSRDGEAIALATELRQTTEALGGFEEGIRLPESREFYWSKIQRQIQREDAPAPSPVTGLSWAARLRGMLMPASGLAVAILLLLVVTHESAPGLADNGAETALQDSGAFTYHDDSARATLVWLSYPAENEIAEDNDSDSLD
jgi:anti-sigma factor RsiW